MNTNFSPDFYKLLYSNDIPMKILNHMRVGTVRQLARRCNLKRDTVKNILKGKKRDEHVIALLFELYAQDHEDYYGEKFTLSALSKLY